MEQHGDAGVGPRSFEGTNLVRIARERGAAQSGARAYLFLETGEEEGTELTFGVLDRRARAVAAAVQAELGGYERARGARVLLMHPPGLEQIVDLLGCMYAGAVPVPTTPPRPNRSMLRTQAQAQDSGASLLLTVSAALEQRERLEGNAPALAELAWMAGDAVPDDAAAEWSEHEPHPDELALLQYTSGSTGTPKGVAVSHQNLLYNEELVRVAYRNRPDSVVVSWLPLHHDMGLMGMALQTLYVGCPCVMMSPPHFVERPARWVEAMSRQRGTMSCAPDFAFDLVARRITPQELGRLDLSPWEMAVDGSEPVRLETLERFTRTFEPAGFRREALRPAYGLAEATLLVSLDQRPGEFVARWIDEREHAAGRAVPAAPGARNAQPLVGCGTTLPGQQIAIVDPTTCELLPEGRVGEIWVSGPSVATGYWQRADESERTFRARAQGSQRAYLRTGDLGYLEDGELFVSGRLKDIVIVRGQNHYPQDLELAAEQSHAGLRPSAAAAFSVELDGREALVLVAELERAGMRQSEEILAAIRGALVETCEVEASAITLIRPSSLPRTSSGKVQRRGTRAAWLAGELSVVAEWRARPEDRDAPIPAAPLERSPAALEAWLVDVVAASLGVPSTSLDAGLSLAALGLDSLRTVRLSHLVERELGNAIPLARLFEGASLDGLARELASSSSVAREGDTDSAPPLENPAPLTQGQRSLWALQRLAPQSSAYHVSLALEARGPIDGSALRRALDVLVRRHDALRTTVLEAEGGEPLQLVHSSLPAAFEELEAGALHESELEPRLASLAARPFDLERGPLVRLSWLRRPASHDLLLLCAHHLVLDQWSLSILLSELARLYEAARAAAGASAADLAALLPPARSFAQLARRQRAWLAGPRASESFDFWRSELSEAPEPAALPPDRRRPPARRERGRTLRATLGPELASGLARFARARGVTPYLVALTAFEALLARSGAGPRFTFGTLAAGREDAERAEVVGYLVNPLVLVGDLRGNPSFEALLERAQRRAARCFPHAAFPFPLLVERLRPARDAARTPLFQTLFVWQHALWGSEGDLGALAVGLGGQRVELGGLGLESLELESGTAQFDLTLTVAELGTPGGAARGWALALEYDSDLYEEGSARRLLERYEHLLAEALAAPERAVGELGLAPRAELDSAAALWQGAQASGAVPALHARLAAQARERPDALALVAGERRTSYAAFLADVEGLAQRLLERGVGCEDVVAVLAGRSLERCAALFAVNVAGAAWMPLDPALPPARRAALLEQAGARLVLAPPELADEVEGELLVLDERAFRAPERPFQPPPVPAAAAAYLLHTSGSTGTPKGVVVSHGALAAHVRSMGQVLELRSDDVLLHMGALGFDLFIEELFPTLLHGARLVVHTDAAPPSIDELHALVEREGVTVLDLPSAYWHAWTGVLAERGTSPPGSLRLVVAGGERAQAPALAAWKRLCGDRTRWMNAYGPTEATVTATCYEAGPEPLDERAEIPIGRPVPLWRAGVLDERGEPAPIGVVGELAIGGAGVARGYLGDARLTAERFVPDALSPSPGGRLYLSGDRARWRSDGELEFLGRADEQVKVRGFRVEPAEAEAELSRAPGVREAALAARSDASGECTLVAYYTGAADERAVAAHLVAHLPQHLVPARLVRLEALPRTATGKLDRRALPEPQALEGDAGEAPEGALETALAGLMAELLGVERVGRRDDFFELGGDSIRSIQLAARAARLGLELSPADVFRHPRLSDLARAAGAARAVAGDPQRSAGPVPLTPIQRWFFAQDLPEPQHHNQHVLLASATPIAARDLERALDELLRRHDGLRQRFEREAGRWRARIEERVPPVPVRELAPQGIDARARERAFEEACARAQRSLDLARPPLLRAVLDAPRDERPQRLFLCAHHLVIDAVSWRLLVDELEELLAAIEAGAPLPEHSAPTAFATYAHWIAARAREKLGAELERADLSSLGGELLACDAGLEGDERVHTSRLEAATTADLERAAREGQTEVLELLVAALAAALREVGGRAQVQLDLEGHGRGDARSPQPGAPELARTLGWFTELLEVSVDLGAAREPLEKLRATRAALRRARRAGRAQWLARYGREDAAPARRVAEVSFNYLGRMEGELGRGRLSLVALGRERAPSGRRSHALEVDALVEGGELRLWWSHPASAAAKVEGLARRFQAELAALLAALAARGPADRSLAEVDGEQLDRILAQLERGAGEEGGEAR